jgi:GntR family transcriptional regulator/MocR family aminotransferase
VQLHIDRRAPEPLHRQIEAQIVSLIESGDLTEGSPLPPTRGLAKRLGVNRSTVCCAYDALAAAGYVESHVGRGTSVLPHHPASAPTQRPASRPDWTAFFAGSPPPRHDGATLSPAATDTDAIDLSGLVPDQRLFPIDRLRRCLDVVLRRDGERLLQYGSARGYEPFLDVLAQRLRLGGSLVDADNLLVVNGAQQGLDLFCRAVLDPGDAVIVENPTYGNLIPLLHLHRAEILPVSMTSDGIDLDELDALLSQRRAKFLYTMPHFQNPTGITATPRNRQRLLQITAAHGVAILEDGFEEDLRWDGGEVMPLRGMHHPGHVCSLGTFSKGLCPGLRIGWLVGDQDLIARLAHLKRNTDYHTSEVLQAALAEFCRRGEYDHHLRRLRRTYRNRMRAAGEALRRHMPPGVRWTLPVGGYSLWLQFPAGISEEEVVTRAGRDGVLIAAGKHFFIGAPPSSCIRLSISRCDEDAIEHGIAVLGDHLTELSHYAPPEDHSRQRPYI